MSNSLRPHGLQHLRLPCPPLSLSFMSIESMMPSNHLILCHPPLHLPSVFSSIRAFPNDTFQLYAAHNARISILSSKSSLQQILPSSLSLDSGRGQIPWLVFLRPLGAFPVAVPAGKTLRSWWRKTAGEHPRHRSMDGRNSNLICIYGNLT